MEQERRPAQRILIIDDELPVLEMLTDLMRVEGYQSVGIADPRLALSTATQHQPDLCLIDIMLPGTSGIEVAEELQWNGFSHTPMIAMSASSLMAQVARSSGVFQGTIAKPFEIWDLIEAMEHVVEETPPDPHAPLDQ